MASKKGTHWADLVAAAQAMTPKEARAQIESLSRDPRFSAVVAWLQSQESGWAATVAHQGLAAEHGKLAHAAGSLHAIQTLGASLRLIVDPPASAPNPGD